MLKTRPETSHLGLKQILERALDKGVVIDAGIRARLVNLELLRIKARILLASFETAARYDLGFPSGINYNTQAWRDLVEKEACPQCSKRVEIEELRKGCPWCGYKLGG